MKRRQRFHCRLKASTSVALVAAIAFVLPAVAEAAHHLDGVARFGPGLLGRRRDTPHVEVAGLPPVE